MGEWHRNNPEAAEEIARLPPSEQLGAERAAMVDPLEVADLQRKERRENPPMRRSLEAEPKREEREEMEMDAREEFSTSFEEVPGTLCPRCDGAGFLRHPESGFRECVACLGTGLER